MERRPRHIVMSFLIWFAVLWFFPCAHGAQYASVVMDMATGRVLHGESATAKTHPASLTKMMTLYMLFDALEKKKVTLQTRFSVSRHAVRQIPSKLGLRVGETIAVRDAILALVTKSANDIAVVVAEGLSGSEKAFADAMTRKAHVLGLRQTTFKNASGVPDKGQITTALDMAKLSRALYHHFPNYYSYFGTKVFSYRGQNHNNHNKLLGQIRGVDGVKTGFINASGFNIATSAERDGRRLIAVVMGGQTAKARDRRVAQLLDASFAQPRVFNAAFTPIDGAGESVLGGASSLSDASFDSQKSRLDDQRRWSVQVGAYGRAGDAHKAAALSLAKLPDDMDPFVFVKPVTHKRRTVFYAQLQGFDQQGAKRACLTLKQQKQPCFAVRGGQTGKPLSLFKKSPTLG